MSWYDTLKEFKEPQRLTDEELDLLLIDVSARIPYNVKAKFEVDWEDDDPDKPICEDFIVTAVDKRHNNLFWAGGIQLQEKGMKGIPFGTTDIAPANETFKPYLRSLTNMTKKEQQELLQLMGNGNDIQRMDFYNSHHLDIRGLIPKGLAIEAPEGMYNIE